MAELMSLDTVTCKMTSSMTLNHYSGSWTDLDNCLTLELDSGFTTYLLRDQGKVMKFKS